uniref:MADF domain-containing protein n=1 Tax=Knipowitschia caucasica TaxID=637954 RepID=A0AAV2LDL5_KNICA
MDHVEERLCEEVRRYVHIYDANSRDYKDAQMTGNSWREISQTLGMDVAECQRRWKLVRDKFVRLKKKMVGRSGDAGDGQKVPGLFHSLSWLTPYVRHRERPTSTNVTPANRPLPHGIDALSTSSSTLPSTSFSRGPSVSSLAGPSTSSLWGPATSSLEENDDGSEQVGEPTRSSTPVQSPPPTSSLRPPRSSVKRKTFDGQTWWIQEMQALEKRRQATQEALLAAVDDEAQFGTQMAAALRRVPREKQLGLVKFFLDRAYEAALDD